MSETSVEESELSVEEQAALGEIQRRGFTVSARQFDFIELKRRPTNKGSLGRTSVVRIGDLTDLANRLDAGLVETDENIGVVEPVAGYIEFALHPLSGPLLGFSRYAWQAAENLPCPHSDSLNVDDSPSLRGSRMLHLAPAAAGPCIELSGASPAFNLFDGSLIVGRDVAKIRTRTTIKVFFNIPMSVDELVAKSREIVDGFLFELDARDNVRLGFMPRARSRSGLPDADYTSPIKVRFPRLKVSREVTALFSSAAEATQNPSFAFLSYYQVLEYYMPMAARKTGIKALRRELNTLDFDQAEDASIVRLLNTIDRNRLAGEEEQLKALVQECVRSDRLSEFLDSDQSDHYSKKGPILGVPSISMANVHEPLSSQVAKRVYAIRNRIVHSKDDPRYANVPVLLPQSREASLLWRDVRLVRMLAIETVVDGQR